MNWFSLTVPKLLSRMVLMEQMVLLLSLNSVWKAITGRLAQTKGATWVDVKDTEGNKVPARGQDGEAAGSNVSWVTVDGVEYIKIGDKVTDLKQNNEFPNIAVDAESKTVIVTIDGQNYTLLQEGSAFKGLQTVVYRKQAVDDYSDVCKAYDIYWQENEGSLPG